MEPAINHKASNPYPLTDLRNWFQLEIFPTMEVDPSQYQLWIEQLLGELYIIQQIEGKI
jgi:hypothetical protein